MKIRTTKPDDTPGDNAGSDNAGSDDTGNRAPNAPYPYPYRPLPLSEPFWMRAERILLEDMVLRMVIVFMVAGVAGLAVWAGLEGHWPLCISLAVIAALWAAEMYLPGGGVFRYCKRYKLPVFPTPPLPPGPGR